MTDVRIVILDFCTNYLGPEVQIDECVILKQGMSKASNTLPRLRNQRERVGINVLNYV